MKLKDYAEFAGAMAMWVVIVLGLGVLLAGLNMWLWNQVMPDIFGLKPITFWQMLCLTWLCLALFKGTPSSSSATEKHLEAIHNLLASMDRGLATISEQHERSWNTLEDIKSETEKSRWALEKT